MDEDQNQDCRPAFPAFRPALMQTGKLAREAGDRLPLQVLKSAAGYYIGTADENGPCSRESDLYFRSESSATEALATGNWSQKEHEIIAESFHPQGPAS